MRAELADLSALDFDLDLTVTGFSTDEIDTLLGGNEDPDDDLLPPVPAHPETRRGDIWGLGEHRVGCDARDSEFVQEVVGDRPWTSPF